MIIAVYCRLCIADVLCLRYFGSTYVQTNENGVGWVEPCAYPILWICPHARLYIIFNSIFWCSSSFVCRCGVAGTGKDQLQFSYMASLLISGIQLAD